MASVTGRIANFFSRRYPAMGRRMTERQIARFRASNGAKANTFLGKPAFLLETVGRTSGLPRPVMLMHVPRGDDLVVVGSNGGNPRTPNWFRNLRASGEADVQVGDRRWSTTFRELPEGDERQECWALAVAAYPDFASYQELTERRLPVGVLEPVPA